MRLELVSRVLERPCSWFMPNRQIGVTHYLLTVGGSTCHLTAGTFLVAGTRLALARRTDANGVSPLRTQGSRSC